MRARYWSNTNFANWIRGVKKPGAQTSKGWNEWEKMAKETNPIRYWIVEEALDKVQSVIYSPVDFAHSIKYYINNRWVSKTHALTANPKDIKPGTWCDVSNRFLPCMFNELVDFVEIESAWIHIAWGDKEDRAKYDAPWYATGWFRWRTWRCPQAGIDHLKWASTLNGNDWLPEGSSDRDKPTGQAIAAKEILELYTWWTTTYRNRPDPYAASGWSDLCEQRRITHAEEGFMWTDRNVEEKKATKKALDLTQKIEAQYEKEDTRMLIRLVKARHHLWT